MVDIKNVTISLSDTLIVEDLSMNVKKSEFVCIIGPNGCGKSTLIKAISGINKVKSGEIFIDGINKKDMKRKDFAKKVAFLMQFNNMPSGMSAREIVHFGRHPYVNAFKGFTKDDYDIVDWAIEQTDIESLLEKDIAMLSGGEKQRVFLAMALAQEPEILILDEPTNHLDIKYQYELLKLVKRINKENNITVICVLHDINQALRFSDKVFVMEKGKLIISGEPSECISPEIMKKVYGIECCVGCRDNNYYVDIL